MRMLKLTLNLMIAAALAAGLTACGSKKGGSGGKTASTPGSNCTYNYQYGYYTDSQGRYCNNTNTNNCQSQGYHYDSYTGKWYNNSNQVVTCNDGGNWGSGGYFPYQGNYNGYYVDGCSQWSYYYPGNQYVPIQVGYNNWVCANVAYISSYYSGFQQQYNNYGSQYFYNNPMYWGTNYPGNYGGGYGGYNGCSTSIGLNFSNNNIGAGAYLCF